MPQKHNRVTPDIVLELIKRFENGETVEFIANDLNFSQATIFSWRNKLIDLNCLNPKHLLKPEKSKINKNELELLLAQGYKLTEIAKKYGVSRQRVHQMKKKLML